MSQEQEHDIPSNKSIPEPTNYEFELPSKFRNLKNSLLHRLI